MALKLRGAQTDSMAHYLIQRWDDMKSERSEREDTWMRCMYAYACKFDKKWVDKAREAGRSTKYYPAISDAVETLVPMLFSVIFNSDDWMTARPTRRGGGLMVDDKLAEEIVYYLAWQQKLMRYTDIADQVIRQMAILGNGPLFGSWRTDWTVNYPAYAEAISRWDRESKEHMLVFQQEMLQYRMQAIQAKMAGQPMPSKPEMPEPPIPPVDKEKVYDGPHFEPLDIFNYCEEMYPNEKHNALKAYRSYKSMAYLERMARPDETGYRRYDNLSAIGDEVSLGSSRDDDVEQLKAALFGVQIPDKQLGVELHHFFGTFERDGNIYDNHVAVVANRRALIRFEPSPLWSGRSLLFNCPLIRGSVGDPYGTGVVEKALGLNDIAQAQANQIIDAVASVINPEYEVVVDGLYDVLKPSGPGVKHYVKVAGTIKAMEKNFQGLPIGMNQLASTLQRIEQSTNAMYAASAGNPKESATMTAGRTNISSTKITHIARAVEERFVEPTLNLMVEMIAQLVNEDQFYMVTQGKAVDWRKISPEQIRKGWLISAVGSRVFLDTEAKLNRDMMTIQLSSSNPALMIVTNIPYLWKKYLKNSGYEDADKIVNESEEAQQAVIQMAVQLAGGSGGNGAGSESPGDRADEGGSTDDAAGAPNGPDAALALILGQVALGQGDPAAPGGAGMAVQ